MRGKRSRPLFFFFFHSLEREREEKNRSFFFSLSLSRRKRCLAPTFSSFPSDGPRGVVADAAGLNRRRRQGRQEGGGGKERWRAKSDGNQAHFLLPAALLSSPFRPHQRAENIDEVTLGSKILLRARSRLSQKIIEGKKNSINAVSRYWASSPSLAPCPLSGGLFFFFSCLGRYLRSSQLHSGSR